MTRPGPHVHGGMAAILFLLGSVTGWAGPPTWKKTGGSYSYHGIRHLWPIREELLHLCEQIQTKVKENHGEKWVTFAEV
jgi:hypothetical protein